MPKQGIHYAKLANSQRLQELLTFLSDHQPHSTRDIIKGTSGNVCAVNTAVCELRANGYNIPCTRKGKHRFIYQLVN